MNNTQPRSKRKIIDTIKIKPNRKPQWKNPPSDDANKDYEQKVQWFDARWDFSSPGQTEQNSWKNFAANDLAQFRCKVIDCNHTWTTQINTVWYNQSDCPECANKSRSKKHKNNLLSNPTANLNIEAIQKNDVKQQLNEDFYFPYIPNGTLSDLCCIHKSDRENAINDLPVTTPIQLKTTKDWKVSKSTGHRSAHFNISDRYAFQLIICSVSTDTVNNVENRFLCIDGSASILKGRAGIEGSYESLTKYGEWLSGNELAQWVLQFKHYRIRQSVCRTPQARNYQLEWSGTKAWTPIDKENASINENFLPSPVVWTAALNSNGYEQEGLKHDVECYLQSEVHKKWKLQVKIGSKVRNHFGYQANIKPRRGCYQEGDWDFIMIIIPPEMFDIKVAYDNSAWRFTYIISWNTCLKHGIGGDNGKTSAYLYPPGTNIGRPRDTWANEYLIDRTVEGWEKKMKDIIKKS